MAKGWKKSLRRSRGWLGRRFGGLKRRRVGWLERIEGVEKPALLFGLGMVLFRAWRAGEPGGAPTARYWVKALRRWRERVGHHIGRSYRGATTSESAAPAGATSTHEEVPDRSAGAAQGSDGQQQPGLGHPAP